MIARANIRLALHRGSLALAVFCSALSTAPAVAQTGGGLPADLVRQAQLTPADVDRVGAYVAGALPDVEAERVDRREAAQDEIIAPLLQSPSPSFRIEYGSLVKGAMERLARTGDESAAVFAVRLAGRLATVDAHALVLRHLDDDRPAVRYAAARAARLQLETLHPGPAALNAQHRDALIDAVASRVRVERDAVVLDGLLTTASDAVRREAPWTPALLEKLAEALPKNIRASAGAADRLAESRAFLRLVGTAQQHFRRSFGRVSESLAHESALLAGHAMGYVDAAVEERPDDAAADALGQLVRAAHNLAFFAHSARTREQLQPSEALPEAFERWRSRGDASDLHREIDGWIGPGGILTRSPYNVDPDAFLHG
jgi:hypothetical protein